LTKISSREREKNTKFKAIDNKNSSRLIKTAIIWEAAKIPQIEISRIEIDKLKSNSSVTILRIKLLKNFRD